jgi:hypothetical protein
MNARVENRWSWAACLAVVTLCLVQPSLGGEPVASDRLLGTVQPRHARAIAGSNWSVGAETMDRDFTIYKNWKQHLGPLGVKKARIQSGWAKTETQPGKYQWAWMDEIVDDMTAQGVTPWVCICYGNTIYPDGGGTGLGGGFPRSPEALAAWDRYVTALVARYKSRVNEWEIWNEPGLHGKKNDKLALAKSTREYADFFIRTARLVRGVQPQAKILGLSLPGIPLPYARGVLERLKEKNAIGLLDELTYHPYKANPDGSYPAVEQLRELARTYAPQARIRQGENGAPSVKGGFGAIANHDWDEQGQAEWALRRLLGDLGRDIPSSYFSICDMKYPDRVNYKGLLAINPADRTVHHVKQSYRAIQHLTAIFDNRLKRIGDFQGRVEAAPADATYALFAYRAPGDAALLTLWRSDRPAYERLPAACVTVVLPGVRFTEPVRVDLVSGRVYAVDKALWSQSDKGAEFRKLPVSGAPLVIAERKAIPLSATRPSTNDGSR